ncbi:hypothetical protein AMJ44_10940 [candidate division WOR-1 bacterium DG_54_3]|uniref:Gluconeogenesis factor n=1 Tax=candidate division WOR-1 bacterium DG_54_3 TaxID=1703775 RepID=A0A0S7XRR4_UNCSA|nr:MAG: hypothetical protein AMJ44_10940 [candidate division WOR-1 bacterium DG_54_3]
MKISLSERIEYGRKLLRSYVQRPKKGPKIVLFTGGTGSRLLACELRKYTHNASHIINTSDSGGSTRELRLLFRMPAIGDFRSRLLDLAGEISTRALLKRRLGDDNPQAAQAELEEELNDFITGRNKLVRDVVNGSENGHSKALIIMDALGQFQAQRLIYERNSRSKFKLKNASIGNLFLTGLYLQYGRDLETPIYFYKQLAEVKGHIIPTTLDYIHLAGMMRDDSILYGQHLITKSQLGPISDIWYVDGENNVARDIEPELNPKALGAIKEAQLIVYAMGSFYTSLLSNLKIPGIAQAIRESSAPKVFIANSVEDEETVGMSAGNMANEIIRFSRSRDDLTREPTDYLTHVIANDLRGESPIFKGKYGGKFRFSSPDTSDLISKDIEVIKTLLLCRKLAKRYESDRIKDEEELNELKNYDNRILARLLFSFIENN